AGRWDRVGTWGGEAIAPSGVRPTPVISGGRQRWRNWPKWRPQCRAVRRRRQAESRANNGRPPARARGHGFCPGENIIVMTGRRADGQPPIQSGHEGFDHRTYTEGGRAMPDDYTLEQVAHSRVQEARALAHKER